MNRSAASVELEAVTVSAASERGSVNAALDQQRTATGVVNSVTSEQISKSPDADAAQAVQRVSGVTVQDGRYVFVRGLGERYTTASLNGTRLPSPEPERKVVPLDLFPAGLLQSVDLREEFRQRHASEIPSLGLHAFEHYHYGGRKPDARSHRATGDRTLSGA